jgi:acyl-CoA reductase-like NAD-dependent aldehyde dehydrogenase
MGSGTFLSRTVPGHAPGRRKVCGPVAPVLKSATRQEAALAAQSESAQSLTRTTRGPDPAEAVQAAAASDSGKVRNGTWTDPPAISWM